MILRLLRFIFKLGVVLFIVSLFVPTFRSKWVTFWNNFIVSNEFEELNLSFQEVKNTLKENVNLPQPLVVENKETNLVSLSVQKIFDETNNARVNEGVFKLSYNLSLEKAAIKKAEDMFALGYFDHNSPIGKTPADFVLEAKYEYLTIGENLALGVFKNEKDLVDAWMNSPGHRANILNTHFTEIGISAVKGFYKGEEVYMSVQEFGKPASLCTAPSTNTKAQIENESKESEVLLSDLKKIKSQIELIDNKGYAYKDMVNEYNTLVEQYNKTISSLERRGKEYNEQVTKYNDCLERELK